ncbi:MAG: 1-acyl-sn-glycerol-3-phosphate acyltransferase [Clostridia bacterium]|nr:1-acyl-sn-glycerol-3-phosphate acyltransferase [Clostridia bacterium]
MFFWICFILAFIPCLILFPAKVIGKKRLPKKQGYILVCNHYSNADAVVLDIHLRKKLRFLAKKELFDNKFAGLILKSYGGIKIDRQKTDASAIKTSIKLLRNNKVLAIFPEGTRNKDGNENELKEVHSGAILIASMAKCPIVPAIIIKKPKVFRKNTIIIGEPFMVENETKTKLSKEELEVFTEKMKTEMENLRKDYFKKLSEKKK